MFDLDAGPVTVKLPDAGAGSHALTREQIGTRYVIVAIRTLVDPVAPKDVAAVHALQDAMTIEQPGGPGRFEVPHWDPMSQIRSRPSSRCAG